MTPALAVATAALPPTDPTPQLKALALTAQQPKARIGEDVLDRSREALRAAPLAYHPFFIAAKAAEQAGDRKRAIALMEEAKRRRPTWAASRMQLILYYTQAQRFGEALAETDIVLRRTEALRKPIVAELAKLIANPQGREALATILAKDPDWAADFFEAASQQKVKVADARDLFRRVRAKKPKGDLPYERELVFQAQAATGDYRGARATWLAALPAAERQDSALLFNGDFRGLKHGRPFGWEFHDGDVGRAEQARDGDRTFLDVAYYGGRSVVLADQMLALTPGRYTLRLIARSDSGVSSGRLMWVVDCLPKNERIGLLDLAGATGADRRLSTTFTVPASGCNGQRISLVAEAGDVASVVNLQIQDMELLR
jgi:tetratricopeptide (TPR) repeat protein